MHSNPQSQPLYQQLQRASWIGLTINIALGLAKLIGGLIGNSFALVADAINSLGDAVTTVIVLYSLKVAQRPPDEEHPYGHTRAEGIAALSVSLLIVFSAIIVGWEALQRIVRVHDKPPLWTLWIAAVNVVVKEGLYRYKVAIGKRTNSMAIIANAWDHRSDALCALAVLLGLTAIRVGGEGWMWADEAAALFVVVAIIWAGGKLFRLSASELMDMQADVAVVAAIRETAASTAEVQAIEKLWVRKSGIEYFVDIHIQVDPMLTVEQGHEIGHVVTARLLSEFPAVRGVLVHLEPYTGYTKAMHANDQFLAARSFAVAGPRPIPKSTATRSFAPLRSSARSTRSIPGSQPSKVSRPIHRSPTCPKFPSAIDSHPAAGHPRRGRAGHSRGRKAHLDAARAEDAQASQAARAAGLNVIDDGSCILVALAVGR